MVIRMAKNPHPKQIKKKNKQKQKQPRYRIPPNYNRKSLVVFSRVRTGHTKLTHSHIISHEYGTRRHAHDTSETILSILHLLTECSKIQ